jgi:sarcosine oxidase subunit beta
MRVVIVGGGVEGTACAWALARRGVSEVIVLERATLGSGGTGKSSGIVRCHYGVPSLAAMAWKGLQVFEGLGADAGFHRLGYVVGVGADDADALKQNVAMQQDLGIEVNLIGHDEMASLWPVAHLEDFAAFAHEPRGGYGDAYQACLAFASMARDLGARIRQGTSVCRILTVGERVSGVQTSSGKRIPADAVVVAAGPWSPALFAPLGIGLPIRAQRSQILLVRPGRSVNGAPVLSDLVSLQYVRTEASGDLLVGNSDHDSPEYADPDSYHDRADDSYLSTVAAKLGHRFPGLPDAAPASSYAGCYDVTPDYNPIVGTTPVNGLYACAGFSGHGFKLSPAVGDLVADLVCDGDSRDPRIPARDFRLGRFAEDALLTSPHPYTGAAQMR